MPETPSADGVENANIPPVFKRDETFSRILFKFEKCSITYHIVTESKRLIPNSFAESNSGNSDCTAGKRSSERTYSIAVSEISVPYGSQPFSLAAAKKGPNAQPISRIFGFERLGTLNTLFISFNLL